MLSKLVVFEYVCLYSSVHDVLVEPESREDKENDDPEDTEGQAYRLWVDRFSPRHYTELLSDDVSHVLVKLSVHTCVSTKNPFLRQDPLL